jgi:hypothetical protein
MGSGLVPPLQQPSQITAATDAQASRDPQKRQCRLSAQRFGKVHLAGITFTPHL